MKETSPVPSAASRFGRSNEVGRGTLSPIGLAACDGRAPRRNAGAPRDCFVGTGEMAALMQATDWSKTPLGPVESWSLSLRMMVSFLLANRFPLLLWWGPQYISIYNDAYRPILGNKHPKSLGQPVSECWAEIWHILKPLIDTPYQGGPATWMDDIFLEVNRRGFVEETHFTIAYSPVPDDTAPRGIGGVLATVHEITGKVVAERRGMVLRDLGLRAAEAKTAKEACAIAAAALADHAKDVPFALFYVIDEDHANARLASAVGIGMGESAAPLRVLLAEPAPASGTWPLGEVVRSDAIVLVDDIDARFPATPPGPWSDPPRSAALVPIRSNTAHQLAGFLVAGVSARLAFDDQYRSFLGLAATQIATAIATARSYEEERKRVEALAEIDRAKTAFFSNVSHEFRTPLTLMLGPLSDLLAKSGDALAPESHALVAVAHRNGLRLLKLVNSLLDFSRIEAGRAHARYEPTDLATLTAELASSFRSACDKAGLTLTVDCPPLDKPVYVDRDMWEKIVLNLISNAFKFTPAGEIRIELRTESNHAVLRVRDTGAGIPAAELSLIFERFHRVEGVAGRTHEGTGIGLALVQELVKLHKGFVTVESEVARGSTFTVRVPLGHAHVSTQSDDNARPLSTATRADAFVSEASRWLRDGVLTTQAAATCTAPAGAVRGNAERARILIADDNADLREYLERLLRERYDIRAVADGEAALAVLRSEPIDLVLSDIMMPRLDGSALVRAVRADPRLADLPVILLSARAGEEASIEGFELGASDYLYKPFSARDLLARVGAHLEIARLRRQSVRTEDRLRAIFETTPECIKIVAPDGTLLHMNPAGLAMIEAESAAAVEGAPIFDLISPADREGWRACHKRICGGERLSWRFEIVGLQGTCRQMETHAAPLTLPDGTVAQLAITRDITQRLRDDEALRELNQTLERRVAERTRALEAETAERRRLQALAQQAQRLASSAPRPTASAFSAWRSPSTA